MRILHLIDSLDFSASARQLSLLGPALKQTDAIEICCMGPETPWATALRRAGIVVHALGWTRWFDFNAWWNLREIVRSSAHDVIHVWRLPALRALAVVAADLLPRVVMSAPWPANGTLAWWDRPLLARVRCLALAGASDRQRCAGQGVTQPRLHVVAPAVERNPVDWIPREHAIACIGKLERDDGFRHAIWTFDFLRYLYTDARLSLVGAGSQLASLQRLTQGLDNASQVQFLGAQANVADVLRDSQIVWIPSQANGGRQVALEAMAQGRPVIASDVPCLREVIRHGETGYLVPRGDVLQYARLTKALFEDEVLRQRIGANARRFVEQQYPFAQTVQCWRDLYRGTAA